MSKKTSEQYELMKKGMSYSFDSYLYGLQRRCAKNLQRVNSLPFDSRRRQAMLTRLFKSYGKNNIIKSNFVCNFGLNISFGNDCFINHGVTILDSYEVEIGNNVFMAPGVIISAVTHPLVARDRRKLLIKKVVIEDDVWIGAGATILSGVTLHKGAVIGAGAVVTKDVDEDTVVVGVPARVLKKIDDIL